MQEYFFNLKITSGCLVLALLMILVKDAQAVSYMTREEALHWALPGAEEIISEEHDLDSKRKKEVEKKIGWHMKESRFAFYVGQVKGKVIGYAFIDDEIGKHQPITFVTALQPDGKVRDVEVMVYRESVGEQIKGRRFLNQFRGKDAASRLKLGEDVDSITGATLSAGAASRAVKKAVVLFQEFYQEMGESK